MKFFNLNTQYKNISKKLLKEIRKNFYNNDFIQGENVKILEKKLLNYTNSNYCLTCANGTDAIKLALKSLNIETNSYIIVPSYTWISTASSVVECGFKPLFCDVDVDSFLIDNKKLNEVLNFANKNNYKVSALISVDLFGNPVEYKKLNQICKKKNIYFISDAAQSFGAKINNSYIGANYCDIMTTSFFPTKTLGCYGDGGAVFFRKKENYEKAKIFAKNGQSKKGIITSGINSRLDTIQATILLEKLKCFKFESIKKKIFLYYKNHLNKKKVHVQKISENNVSGHSVMTLKINSEYDRKKFMINLNKNNIPTKIYYSPPLHKTKFYSKFPYDDMNNTNFLSNYNISIPIYPYIPIKSLKKICNIINSYKN